MQEYTPEDFSPPLSDDAALVLKFLNEKKRIIARKNVEIRALKARIISGFLAGVSIGIFALALIERWTA